MRQFTESEYKKMNWWRDVEKWIKAIPSELDSKKGAKPLKAWRVFEAETLDAARDAARAAAWDAAWAAARAATLDAALDAARAAARDAARAAAWDAARAAARDAAWDAAQAAASDAAQDAARAAARDAALDAAWDAALLARVKICAGLKLDQKHVKHAEERWEANKRGFRVYCDVNGVLYVYRKKERGRSMKKES